MTDHFSTDTLFTMEPLLQERRACKVIPFEKEAVDLDLFQQRMLQDAS